jgi:hypothetical protein
VFKTLGVLVLVYTGYAVAIGEVYAKDGWRGRYLSRAATAGRFWSVVVVYAGLGAALLMVF